MTVGQQQREPRTWNPLPITGGAPTMQEILQHVVEEYNRNGYPYAATLRAMTVLPRISRTVPKKAWMLAAEEGCSKGSIYQAIAVGKDALNGGGDVPLYSGNDGYLWTFDPVRMAESRYRFAHDFNTRLRRYRNSNTLPWVRSLTDPAEIADAKLEAYMLEQLVEDSSKLLDQIKRRHP